jgi:uncharacterized phosphosugar-binding protein
MSGNGYLDSVRQLLDFLQVTQETTIDRAARLIGEAMRQGGTINCSDIGHHLQWDFINRAGGLVAVQPFSFSFSITHPAPACHQTAPPADQDLARIRFAVEQSGLHAGDVMLVSSVSGRNRAPIELALACRACGIAVIGFTAMTYTRQVESLHPSGKRLFEVVDVAIDCGAPYGDAGVRIPGYDISLVPMSGVGMLVSGWLLWARVMELMASRGTPASVLLSHNRDGGPQHNEESRQRYQQEGY